MTTWPDRLEPLGVAQAIERLYGVEVTGLSTIPAEIVDRIHADLKFFAFLLKREADQRGIQLGQNFVVLPPDGLAVEGDKGVLV